MSVARIFFQVHGMRQSTRGSMRSSSIYSEAGHNVSVTSDEWIDLENEEDSDTETESGGITTKNANFFSRAANAR